MAKITIHATLHVAWWWKYYITGVRLIAELTGLQPDRSKVEAWAKRAVTIRFNGGGRNGL